MIRRVSIQIANDHRLDNDVLFDANFDPNLSVFRTFKEHARQNDIQIQTLDKSNPDKSDILLFFNTPYPSDTKSWCTILKNKKKNILILLEPPMINPFNYFRTFHRYFKRVFTWNDNWVDNIKYFKYYIGQSYFEIDTHAKLFNEKKFLVMINGNKLPFYPFTMILKIGKELYSERIKCIEYFEKNIPNNFTLYGQGWNKPKKYNLTEKFFGFKFYGSYKGEIKNKIEALSHYKFCLCFENLTEVRGYLTEKIFDCLKARCIPVYWGASNIDEYIPSNCYIDYRKFMSPQVLLKHLETIGEIEYDNYIKNINCLLSDVSFLNRWFEGGWAHNFLKVLQ